MRLLLLFSAVVAACTASTGPGPAASTKATEQRHPAADATSSEGRATAPDDTIDEPATGCKADAECHACATERGCGCFPSADACPETMDACFVAPCEWRVAACVEGRCVLPPAFGPCHADEDCETRPDPFRCGHVPARKGAPTVKPTFGCGERPDPPAARCDVATQACVLDSAAAPGPVQLTLRCSMHGTALTTTTTEVGPGEVSVEAEGTAPRKFAPAPTQIAEISSILGSPGFAAFLAEAPIEAATPHPGMTTCEIEIGAPKQKTPDKKWTRGDTFSPAAQAALEKLESTMASLTRSTPAHPSGDP